MVTPTWSWLLTRWSLEPSVVAGIVMLTLAYACACGYRLTGPASLRCSAAQRTWFLLSDLVLVIALLSPLDGIGDTYLFSAHMVQHLLLATVWPPLLLLSLPADLTAGIQGMPVRVLGLLTLPAVAFLLFNGDITVWHLPVLYDLTLRSETVHILEHLTFMGTGLVVWWPVLNPVRRGRLSYAGQELYLFANLFPTMALGILFSFLQHPLYGPYIHAPRLWGISALTDQQIGGLIMWMPGNLPYVVAMATIGVIWLDRGEPVDEPRREMEVRPRTVP